MRPLRNRFIQNKNKVLSWDLQCQLHSVSPTFCYILNEFAQYFVMTDGPQRISLIFCDDPMTFPVAPPWFWNVAFIEMLLTDNYWTDWRIHSLFMTTVCILSSNGGHITIKRHCPSYSTTVNTDSAYFQLSNMFRLFLVQVVTFQSA